MRCRAEDFLKTEIYSRIYGKYQYSDAGFVPGPAGLGEEMAPFPCNTENDAGAVAAGCAGFGNCEIIHSMTATDPTAKTTIAIRLP